jgi:Homeodomain-like domain
MATMKAAERELRDARVMQMFYAGASYREIAEAVGLRSKSTVGQIVQRALVATGDRRELLSDEARSVWLERFEQLWGATWPQALEGDRYAATECRRLLGQWASVFGLSKKVTFADAGRLEVVDLDPPERDEDLADMDELTRLRYERAFG